MTLLDDARRLLEIGVQCDHCSGSPQSGHLGDCPLPRIVAALEAAEQYIRTGHPQDWFPAALALEMAEIRDTPRGRVFVATIDDPVPPA